MLSVLYPRFKHKYNIFLAQLFIMFIRFIMFIMFIWVAYKYIEAKNVSFI